jgi:hypothetical protein
VLDLGQDFLFGHDVFLLILFEDVFFLQHLEGVQLVVLEVPNQQHLGIGAFADHRECRKVFDRGSSAHDKSLNTSIINL